MLADQSSMSDGLSIPQGGKGTLLVGGLATLDGLRPGRGFCLATAQTQLPGTVQRGCSTRCDRPGVPPCGALVLLGGVGHEEVIGGSCSPGSACRAGAQVSLDKREATVTFDDSKANVDAFIRATRDAGSPSTLVDSAK